MNKSRSPLKIIYSKPKYKSVSKSIEDRIRAQLSPLFKISKSPPTRTYKSFRKKTTAQFIKSTRYSSPNSNQSSEKVSKNPSKQKLNMFKQKKNRKESRVKKKKRDIGYKSFEKIKILNSLNKTTPVVQEINQQQNEEDAKQKWKNSILQRFVVNSRACSKCQAFQMVTLQTTLKSYLDEEKSNKSRSFLHFALRQGEVKNNPEMHFNGRSRILTIDWMYLISASLLLNRETVHLAVHYLDSYFEACGGTKQYIHTIASACLYLSVKQEERDSQAALIETICLSEKLFIQKSSIIEMEQNILKKLNYRLKSNTLAFWIDYFTLKWDDFVNSQPSKTAISQIGLQEKILLRDPDGQCYQLYRQIMEMADCCLMFGEQRKFSLANIALASMYLIIRIQIEKEERKKVANKENRQSKKNFLKQNKNSHKRYNESMNQPSIEKIQHKQEHPRCNLREMTSEELFKMYHKQFMKKASPIFKDPFRVNHLFNIFLTELCQFQITEIIPVIKHMSHFLDLEFSYNIDDKAMQQTESYEDFIRRMTYSVSMKDYALNKFF